MQRAAQFIEGVGLNLELTDELIMAASKAAVKIMTENIATVRRIADVLEQKKRIEGYEIRKIIRQSKEAARS
jgi:ATP-dependent Zn protease